MYISKPKRSIQTLLMALALASPAHAELVNIALDATGHFEHEQDVAPGKIVEVCGRLATGQTVRWSFQADAPLNFNIHYHEGKKVEYPVRQDGIGQLQGTLPVNMDQDYCWMWTNKSSMPVSLRVRLAR
jgi:hypothetical protein